MESLNVARFGKLDSMKHHDKRTTIGLHLGDRRHWADGSGAAVSGSVARDPETSRAFSPAMIPPLLQPHQCAANRF